jgi:hypothetical protein
MEVEQLKTILRKIQKCQAESLEFPNIAVDINIGFAFFSCYIMNGGKIIKHYHFSSCFNDKANRDSFHDFVATFEGIKTGSRSLKLM